MTPAYWMFQVFQVSSVFKGGKCPVQQAGQWPVRPAGVGGADQHRYRKTRYRYILILQTHRKRYRVFLVPISVYSDIGTQYRDHVGHDIVEKPDFCCGNLRVCPDIDPISGPISGGNLIPGSFPDIGCGNLRRRVCSDIVPISGFFPDIGADIGTNHTISRPGYRTFCTL